MPPRAFSRVPAFIIFMLSVVFCAGEAALADYQKPTEYDVKAAYVYNFAKFVEWPPVKSQEGGAAINVCVFGNDPFGPAIAAIEGKSVGAKKIRITRNLPLSNVRSCDILFIGNSERENVAQILEAVRGTGILTIGDTKGFAQQGVMINFFIENKTVRFEINPKAALRAGLKISSNLLRIAKIVAEQ